MKELELFDGCSIMIETTANTVDEFLETVPTKWDSLNGKMFFYGDEWYPAFDLDFITA